MFVKYYMYVVVGIGCFFEVVYQQDQFENLLEKFHQHDYEIIFERADVTRYNKKYMKFASCSSFKYNRTDFGINLTYSMRVDIGYDLLITAQVYKFLSNEYRYFPIRMQIKACDILNNNLMGYGDYTHCGNFTGCPLLKGTYIVCNFMHNPSKFPPYIPSGKYKLEFLATYLNEEVFLGAGYGSIIRPVKTAKI